MIDQINSEIQKKCNDLIEEAKVIAQLPHVSHLSKSWLQFTGGILGAIHDYREGKRLEKLMNTPIYKDISFYQYAWHLIDITENLVEMQLEVQKECSENDTCYFDNVIQIINSVSTAHIAWYEYSPDMAMEGIKVGEEDNVSLELTVKSCIKESFCKMHLPEGISFSEDQQQNNKGCLGILLLLIIPVSINFFLTRI